jgi:hypothetical protein
MSNDGGFLRPVIEPTPPATSASNQVNLPHPRQRPLKSGSNKEAILRQYLDNAISQVNRKHAIRGSENHGGFANFGEISKELDTLFNLIWISGTRK